MEAILPASAAPKLASPVARQDSSRVVVREQPRAALPLIFMLSGVMALAGALLWIMVRPEILSTYHYNQYVIAATHLVVLGFVSSVIMGAMYQLAPVALETQLFSRRLAWTHLAVHMVSVAGMVWMFARWDMKQVGHFGSAFALGAGLFIYNIARTVWRGKRGALPAIGMGMALFWFAATLTAGLMIAAGKCSYDSDAVSASGWMGATLRFLRGSAAAMARFDAIGAMHAHAHLGVMGFFVTLLMGVSYKLVPMFVLSDVQSRRRAIASMVLLSVGVASCFFTILLGSPLKPFAGLVVCAGLLFYGWEMRAILRARKRRALDLSMRIFLAGLWCLVPLSVLGMVLAWPRLPLTAFTGQLENLYGVLALLGLLGLAIQGMLYKVVPFLVWYVAYSPHVGSAKVPVFADMYSRRLQAVSFAAYSAGLVIACVAIVAGHGSCVRMAAGICLAGVLMLAVNMSLILRHLFRPQLLQVNNAQ